MDESRNKNNRSLDQNVKNLIQLTNREYTNTPIGKKGFEMRASMVRPFRS